MDAATGAMGSLIPKLVELLKEEYRIQTRVKKDVELLEREMKSMEAALRKVAMVPRDQLDEQVKIWANDVRELSYQMEDLVDSFLVRVEHPAPAADQDTFKGLMKKMANLFKKGKTRHQIADAIKDIKDQVQEVAARRDRYKVDDVAANQATTSTVDPRVLALFKDQRELVGIEETRDEIIKRLTDRDDGASKEQPKILSISGFGGLGKTTLAKAVYDVLRPQFDSGAFVSVGRNPIMKNILKEMVFEIDKKEHADIQASTLDETQLIKQIIRLLQNKSNLQKLQVIEVNVGASFPLDGSNNWSFKSNVLSRHLRRLNLPVIFPRLPQWIDSSHFPHLFFLALRVKTVQAQDMEILGRFPKLITLILFSKAGFALPDMVGGGAFPKLRYFACNTKPRFLLGAMPCLEYLRYFVTKRWDREHDSIQNLPCLEKLDIYMPRASATDKEEVEAALTHALKVHPNNPTLIEFKVGKLLSDEEA